MINVDVGSAAIGGRFDLAKPDVVTDGGRSGDLVVVHLTHKFDKMDPEKSGAALRIDGQVGIAGNGGGSPANFEVAFLQFARFNFVGLFYAGRKHTEGSIGMLAHPAMAHTVLTDANKTMPPWMSETTFTRDGNVAKNSMGDHPFLQCARQAPNFTTGVANFLFHMIYNTDFWSVFSVRTADGKFQHLMHLQWHLRQDVRFRWRAGVPQLAHQASRFTADEQATRGPPTEGALQKLLAQPGPPFATDELKDSLQRAARKPPNPHRSDNPTRFPNVPSGTMQTLGTPAEASLGHTRLR
jgi:hypothetical protein